MRKLLTLFFISIFANAASPAPKGAEKVEEKAAFDEKEFKKQMQAWNDKIKSLNEGKVPDGIFAVAEKIISINPDMLLVLAEDLAVIISEKPKLVEGIRKQWLPVSLKPVFVGSSGETLYELAVRLAKDGNG